MSEVHANKIYVRVKRGREEDPAENLCIVEEAAPAKKRSTWSDPTMGITPAITDNSVPRKLILSRVRTLRCADDALIHESSNMADYAMEEEQPIKRKRVAAKVIVTSGTKTVVSETSESYVIIDMSQIPSKGPSDKKREVILNPVAKSSPASKVLDPATRMLERGIDKAVKNGDFNEISSALMQGANGEHQSKTNGFTPLMAATLHCNVRMVKRLLMKGVDVLKTNQDGLIALELLKVTNRNMKDAIEIQSLLQAAAAKTAHPSSMRAATVRENIKRSNNNMHRDHHEEGAMELEADYVYDIYCVNAGADAGAGADAIETPQPSPTGPADDGVMSEEGLSLPTEDPLYSIVRVEGLRIHDDGKVELMMAYDSDWSDLGDDEEPDSNDERFFGNDYPEDEENDGEELLDESDDELAPYRAAQQKHALRKQNEGISRARAATNSGPAFPASTATNMQGLRRSAQEPLMVGVSKVRFASGTSGAGEQSLDELEVLEAEYTFEDALSGEEEGESGADGERQGYCTYYDGEGDGEDEEEEGGCGGGMADCDLRGDYNSDYDMEADDAAEAAELAQHRNVFMGTSRQKNPLLTQRHSVAPPGGAGGGPFAGKSRKESTSHLSSDSDLLYGDDDNLPAFERRFGVGKVLRPQLIHDHHGGEDFSFADQGLYEEPHTTESLQALWGEEAGNREDYSGTGVGVPSERDLGGIPDTTHGDRLHHMRQRTGMVFAATAREFDPHSGLAKYGADLSDDEGFIEQGGELVEAAGGSGTDVMWKGLMHQNGNLGSGLGVCREARDVQSQCQPNLKHVYRSVLPPADTIAYDSELDASD